MKYLQGKRILLTRTAEQNQATAKLVRDSGAIPVCLPCASIEVSDTHIHRAMQVLQSWPASDTDVIFSSRNGVWAVAQTVPDMARILSAYRVVAVGAKTAGALRQYGIHTVFQPDTASQQGLIRFYQNQTRPRHAVFFRARIGSSTLTDWLSSHGIQTHLCPAYDTHYLEQNEPEAYELLQHGDIDAVLLGSARTAEFYAQKTREIPADRMPVVATMSPQVTKAADKWGLRVQVTATEPSFEAMLHGLNDYFATQEKG